MPHTVGSGRHTPKDEGDDLTTGGGTSRSNTHLERKPELAVGAGGASATAPPTECLQVLIAAPRIDLDPSGPSVSVVIPALNEARNLPWLASRMPPGVGEIILVDGHSTDDTIAVARHLWPHVRVVTQTRRGKGNALACGFAAAARDVIVMIDADGSMDPGEIPYFVAALVANADYAKGSRFAPGGGSSDITRFRGAGNHVLNALTGLIHRTSFTDLCYGFNAFWRRILPVLGLEVGEGTARCWGDGFEVETLINIRVHSAGLKVTEVPSFEGVRLHGSSNLRAFADGWRVLSIIARESRALRKASHGSALAQLLEEPITTTVPGSASHEDDRLMPTLPHKSLMAPIKGEPHLAEMDDPLERLAAELEKAADLADLPGPGDREPVRPITGSTGATKVDRRPVAKG